MPPDADADLLTRWCAGDREAYAVLVARHYGLVQAACRRQAAAGEDEDCAQAVFLILARKPASAARAPVLAAWLLRVAWFVCRNAHRVALRRRQAEREAVATAGASGEARPEALDHLDGCLLKLPEKQRAAVTLHYLTGQTPDEVAVALGTSRDNAYQLISRGLAGLRAQLSRRGIAVTGTALASVLAAEAQAAMASAPTAILASLSSTPSIGVNTLATGAMHAMTISRLIPIASAAGLLIAAALTTVALTAEPALTANPMPVPMTSRPDAVTVMPPVRLAVDRGLAWLIAQQREDGTWRQATVASKQALTAGAEPQLTAANVRPGIVAICTLSLLGAGETTAGDPRSKAIAKGLAFLRSQIGTFAPGCNMYDHAFATLCLAEALTLSKEDGLQADVRRAVDLIVAAQNPAGGWRYMPRPADADVSVTVCQLVALRAARQAGVVVPESVIVRGLDYVRSCSNRVESGRDGGFAYTPSGASGFARTGAGLFVLLAQAGDEPLVQDGLAFLRQVRPAGAVEMKEFYWYGHYYIAAALRQAQVLSPAHQRAWVDWYAGLSAEFLASQQPDGYWGEEGGDPLPTALACIVLQLPDSRLPVFNLGK